jgi:hypothetical protein
MILICVALIASVVIGGIKLATTPDEILGSGFQGIPETEFPR